MRLWKLNLLSLLMRGRKEREEEWWQERGRGKEKEVKMEDGKTDKNRISKSCILYFPSLM